ncbi:MAG: hypothetical protein IKR26_01695 [Lachnospiraceae bacterium]|nr:hypothetical protein [Lachnospiraceae bacterium]
MKAKRYIIFAVVSAILISLCPATGAFAEAPTVNHMIRAMKNVKVYKVKTANDSNLVTELPNGILKAGSYATAVEITYNPTYGSNWLKIGFANKDNLGGAMKYGYIRMLDSNYNKEVFENLTAYGGHFYEKSYVKLSTVVRDTPSSSGNLVTTLEPQQEVFVDMGITPDGPVINPKSTGAYTPVMFFCGGVTTTGYAFLTYDAEKIEHFTLSAPQDLSHCRRLAYAQGTDDKVTYGDKVPVYSTRSLSSTPVKLLNFGESVRIQGCSPYSNNKNSYWICIRYGNDQLGYCFQENRGAPIFTYVNINENYFEVTQNGYNRQWQILNNAMTLYNKGTKLQYKNTDRHLKDPYDRTKSQQQVNNIYNTSFSANIDCSSFVYSVFYRIMGTDGEPILLFAWTKGLMNYAVNHPEYQTVKAVIDGDQYNADFCNNGYIVDTKKLTKYLYEEKSLRVGDLIVTRTVGENGDEGHGHVMIVYSMQKNVVGDVENIVLIHSTGSNTYTESKGTVQMICLNGRFIGESHTSDIENFAVLCPKKAIKSFES